jgi:hypothetical protein
MVAVQDTVELTDILLPQSGLRRANWLGVNTWLELLEEDELAITGATKVVTPAVLVAVDKPILGAIALIGLRPPTDPVGTLRQTSVIPVTKHDPEGVVPTPRRISLGAV